MITSITKFNDVYLKLLIDLYNFGESVSPRGYLVKEILNYNFSFSNPENNVITVPGFETNIDYAEEELSWYYSGSNRIDFSPLIKRTWKQFSDDGIHVNSAYGYRIFRSIFNQWEWIKNKLKDDPDTRQAVININSVDDKKHQTLDFPCTMYLQLFLRNNKLHWITNIRSTDAVLGIRNDVYCFTKMQCRMAEELGIIPGEYHQHCGSIHIYEKHFLKLEKLVSKYTRK